LVSGGRLPNLGAGSGDERVEDALAPIFVRDQLSVVLGMAHRTDRFERGVGQRYKIGVFGDQLHPEPGMVGSCAETIRLGEGNKDLRAADVIPLTEPQADDSPPEFGDRPGKSAVGRHSLLAQPLVASRSLGMPCVQALKYVGASGPQQGSSNSDHTGGQAFHGDLVCLGWATPASEVRLRPDSWLRPIMTFAPYKKDVAPSNARQTS
jgi:hypothetical protein